MPDTLRLFGLVTDSIVDGPGYRTSIFTQGCPHGCPGCHNPESHAMEAGPVWKLDDIEKKFTGNPMLSGITLSGGEPFLQAEGCAALARRAHAKGLNVWTYSGFSYEQLLGKAKADDGVAALLGATDVLVDGPFLLAERSLDLEFRGSRNQRLIDMNRTRERGEIVLYTSSEWV